MNGFSRSPQQQQSQHMSQQQSSHKTSQMPNGIRQMEPKKPDDLLKSDRLFPYGTKSLQEPTNGRRHPPYPDRNTDLNEKNLVENNDRNYSHNNVKNSMAPPMSSNVPNSSTLFSKPFKPPPQQHHDKQTSSSAGRPILNHIAPSSTPTGAGENVENILRMMKTSFVEPLSKIAATPRTELDVQTPNKNHVYAGLPPLFRGASGQRKFL